MHFVNWEELHQMIRINLTGYYVPKVDNFTFDEFLLQEMYDRYLNEGNQYEKLEQVSFVLGFTAYNAFTLATMDLNEEIAIIRLSNGGINTELFIATFNDCLMCAEYDKKGFIVGFVCPKATTEGFLSIITSRSIPKMKILLPNKEEYLKG